MLVNHNYSVKIIIKAVFSVILTKIIDIYYNHDPSRGLIVIYATIDKEE